MYMYILLLGSDTSSCTGTSISEELKPTTELDSDDFKHMPRQQHTVRFVYISNLEKLSFPAKVISHSMDDTVTV